MDEPKKSKQLIIWNEGSTCKVIAIYATSDLLLSYPDKTYAMYIWNKWNIRLQHVLIYLLPPMDAYWRGAWCWHRGQTSAQRGSRWEARGAAHGAKARGAGGAREARRRGRKGQAGASRPGRQTFGREHYRFKLLQFLEREPCWIQQSRKLEISYIHLHLESEIKANLAT
jgi:hypothetical protein